MTILPFANKSTNIKTMTNPSPKKQASPQIASAGLPFASLASKRR